MNRLFRVLVVAGVVAAPWADAHACDPVGTYTHVVDPAMQAADQTPPTLPAIPPPRIHFGEGSSQGGCGRSDCADLGSVAINVMATDDMTTSDKIGYRFNLAAGTLPRGFTLPTTAVDPNLLDTVLLYFDASSVYDFDFTLQVVAVDTAGNESAPQSVLVRASAGNACAIAPPGNSRDSFAALAVATLLLAAILGRRKRGAR